MSPFHGSRIPESHINAWIRNIGQNMGIYYCAGVNGGRDATATLFLLLDLATFFDLFHGGKLDEALDTLTKIKIIPLNQQDVDYLVAGL